MKDQILSRAHTIATGTQAKALADPLRRRVVLRLIPRARSIAELAQLEGIELKRLHYHVGALVRIGLLVVAGKRRRAGRAIKEYRAVAEAFFVPDGLADTSPGETLARELQEALRQARGRACAGSLLYSENDQPRMRWVPGQTTAMPLATEHWQVLRLSKDRAARLFEDIARCVKACAAERGASRQATYLVHLAMAPAVKRDA